MPESDEQWLARDQELVELFTPSIPIDENDLFAGRSEQIGQLIEAVLQRGQHAILFGERGVGKTSLAKTFSTKLIRPTKTLSSVIVNCNPGDSFESLWLKVYEDMGDGSGQVSLPKVRMSRPIR